MANQFVRSYTSDPGAGQRFIVGLGPSKQTGGILGFGLTPEESAKMRRQKLAQSMGLEMQGVENLPEQSIVQMGVQSQRQRQEYAQRAALQQQEQEAEERERSAKMDALKGLAKQRFAGKYTPVEIDQLAQGGVLQQMVMGGYQDEHKEQLRTMQEAARQKQAEAFAKAYQDPQDQKDAFDMAVQGVPPGMIDTQIKTRMKEREQGAKEQQKAQAEQAKMAEEAKQYEAIFVPNSPGHMLYKAKLAGGAKPSVAAEAARREALEASSAQRNEEREDRRESLEGYKLDMQEADEKLAEAQAKLKEAAESGDQGTVNQWADRVEQLKIERQEIRAAYRQARSGGIKAPASAGQPEQPPPAAQPAPGPGTPAPAAGSAADSSVGLMLARRVREPVQAQAPGTTTADAGAPAGNALKEAGVQREVAAKIQMGAPPQTKETLKRVRQQIVEKAPHLLPRYLVEVAQLAAQLPNNRSADDAWIQAARALAAKYEAQMMETVERVPR